MTIEEFCKLCDQHDWGYQYSDDNNVYVREQAKREVLRFIAIKYGGAFDIEYKRRAAPVSGEWR